MAWLLIKWNNNFDLIDAADWCWRKSSICYGRGREGLSDTRYHKEIDKHNSRMVNEAVRLINDKYKECSVSKRRTDYLVETTHCDVGRLTAEWRGHKIGTRIVTGPAMNDAYFAIEVDDDEEAM
jgi:hypothetical protein